MSPVIRTTHKYLSLAVALLWLVEAVTGVLLVVDRQLEGLKFSAVEKPIDLDAINRRLDSLVQSHPGDNIPFIYTAGKNSSLFDVYLHDPDGKYRVLRINGDGSILRNLPSNPESLDAGFFELMLNLHERLLSGEIGYWFVGLSGLLLASNLCFGLTLAWPRKGQWRRALKVPKLRKNKASFYKLHRTFGLWLVVPAIVSVAAGTLVVFGDLSQNWLGPVMPAPTVAPVDNPAILKTVSAAGALRIALGKYPDARISFWTMPSSAAPYYEIVLLQPGEIRDIYGTTTLYVSAENGKILANYDALKAPLKTSVLNAFYPIHTGEVFGLAGRLAVMVVGIWLMIMIGLGLGLWWLKRPTRK